MPSDLLTNSEPETSQQDRPKNPPTNAAINVNITTKNPKLAPPNKSTWNPKLLAALTVPLKDAGQPQFTNIMQFFKKDAYSIYLRGYPVCAPCFFCEKCTKNHTPATEAQVQPILNLLSEFIKDPSKIKAGQ